MPDANGNFRGITVSGEAWTRIFGERMAAHDHDWPEDDLPRVHVTPLEDEDA